MLEHYLRKGINFKRATETLNAGIELAENAKQEKNDRLLNVVQQTKEKVKQIVSEYNIIYAASSLWAVKQKKLMQELRQSRAVQSKSDEADTQDSMRLSI